MPNPTPPQQPAQPEIPDLATATQAELITRAFQFQPEQPAQSTSQEPADAPTLPNNPPNNLPASQPQQQAELEGDLDDDGYDDADVADNELDQQTEDPLVAENRELRARLDKLTELIESKLGQQQQPQQQQQLPPHVQKPLQPVDFIKGTKVEELFQDEDIAPLNEMLNSVVNEAYNAMYQQVLTSVPGLVQANINRLREYDTKAQAFWQKNRDLLTGAETADDKKAIERLVVEKATRIAAESPRMSFEEIGDKAAEEVRGLLKLRKPGRQRRQRFPNAPGATGPKRLADAQQQQQQMKDPNSAASIAAIFRL